MLEEWGGDPNGIFLVRREVDSICADIYEWQPNLMSWQMQVSGKVTKPLRPKAHLSCGPGQKISSIKFASFGTPEGVCGSFREGGCHAHKSYDAFQRVYYLAQLMFSFSFHITTMPWNFFSTFEFDESNYQLCPASAWSLTNLLLFMIQANKDGQKLWLHGLSCFRRIRKP